MKVISINAGSSTLKFKMYEMPEEKVIVSGLFERIGAKKGSYSIKYKCEKETHELEMKNHVEAFKKLVDVLIEKKIVKDLNEIEAVGHRIVQGGAYFSKSEIVTEDVYNHIKELAPLAPLHNPAALNGIDAAKEVIPEATHVTVFDTAFHQTMDEVNYIYPVPYEWYEKYNVRRYGAHGTSHKYVSGRMNEILGRKDTKLITCHIGSGASISAVVNGKCVDTSMGLTPNAGIMMGTRCGDIDATIVLYMMNQTGMTTKEMDRALNKESGLLGVSGLSDDSRDIEKGIADLNERAILAQKIYVKRIVDFIAKYYVEMGGCDGIVFTAGVGENSVETRRNIMDALEVLGVKCDRKANNMRGEEKLVSTEDSKIPVYVIPTDEELMIARDAYSLSK